MSRTLRPLSLAMGRLEFINGTFIFFILLSSNSNWKAWYTHQNKIGHSLINPCLQNKLIQNLKLKKKKKKKTSQSTLYISFKTMFQHIYIL